MSRKELVKSRKHVLQELNLAFSKIKSVYKFIKKLDTQGEEVLGSGQWLLDNIYIIEKEYKSIKENMPNEYFDNLPKYDSDEIDSVPRIFVYAKEYIKRKGCIVKNHEVIKFIKNKDDKFTMGELWAFPLMLRIAIILKLSRTSEELRIIHEDKLDGKLLAYEIIDASIDKKLKHKLKKLDNEIDELSGMLLSELLRVLKDNSIDDKEVYSLIDKKTKVREKDEEIIKNNFLEASIEQSIESCISSLREIEAINWKEFFNSTSRVEELLNMDPDDTYKNMDFKSKDYYRHKIEELSKKLQIDEITLTEKILYLSRRSKEEGKRSYRNHVGYYIIDDGVNELIKSFNINDKVRMKFSEGLFVFTHIFVTVLIIASVLYMSYLLNIKFTRNQYLLSVLVMIIPASEIVTTSINWITNKIVPIRFVPKLDYSLGIPDNKKSIVVIPAMLSSKERTKELVEQLEVTYLANKESNLYFALLGDLEDSKEAKNENEDEIIKTGLDETLKLNTKYFDSDKHFFFLVREKVYNPKEGVYMGRERKRGKLMEFMALLRNKGSHSFNIISSDISYIKEVKYLITLDADTFVPRDSVKKLVGAMSHILNRACIKNNRINHGYGVMQPKVSISLESKNRSLFSKIFAGDGGIDGYSIAYSDVYEDLFGEGNFTGKGIIDIDVFYNSLKDEIPDNKVLSHDLLEGAYSRCALVTDIEFIDDYPSNYEASCKRLHRWARGDWQLLRWLFSRKISLLSKWKIFDNLRRSLLAPSLLLAVFLNLTVLKGKNQIMLLCFFAIISSLIFIITDFVVTPKNKINGTFKSFKQIILIISFIPYQAFLMADAIIRTLFRILISKKKLLQWQTAEDAERTTNNSLNAYMKRMWFSTLCGIFTILLALDKNPAMLIMNCTLGILWVFSPYIAFYISISNREEKIVINDEERNYLRVNARRIWAYYEDFVNEENNYLAPDNYQEVPYKGVANRTSPTNIGMGLISNLVAYDLGYIGIGGVVDRVELILNGMSKLEQYKGHYLNWYDTKNCKALWPKYISTVDSGNLLGYLWIISKTLVDYKKNPITRIEEVYALRDTIKISGMEEIIDIDRYDISDIRNYSPVLEQILSELELIKLDSEDKEQMYWIEKLKKEIKIKISYNDYFFGDVIKFLDDKYSKKSPSTYELLNYLEELLNSSGEDFKVILEEKIRSIKSFLIRIDSIILRINNIMEAMDFLFLYNKDRGLFSIGYNLEENSLGNSYYDLLASESRATSFIAIARNQIPKDHWFNLNRAIAKAFKSKSLVSWSGTMFEYFMPALIMKSFDNTLLSMTYSSVIKAQKEFAKQKKVPWGISESAYYQFDASENYQYKAFGIPGIGLKRGLEDELVISPYSTLITLPYSKSEGIDNLKLLESKGAYGRYGFIESIDYTSGRVGKMDIGEEDISSKNVRCYMVHHLGMSLIALDNTLNDNIFQKRFHNIPEVKATELLLKEKIPTNIVFEREEEYTPERKVIQNGKFIPRLYIGAETKDPEISLLSNGSYSMMLTVTGSGYAKKDNMMIYRWKGDTTSDSSGMFFYVKNLNSNDYWSSTYEPCKSEGEDYTVEFTLDKAKYKRIDGSIETIQEVTVSPEDDVEIRRLTFRNIGDKGRSIEVTSYSEITLQSFEADVVHPSFSNLFIGTEYVEDEKCLLANRRARVKNGKVPYVFQKVIVPDEIKGAITYETSRENFIGRNRDLKNPSAMNNDKALMNTVGTVLDPIMSMRVRLRLEVGDEKEVFYIVGISDSREKVINLARKYSNKVICDKAFGSYNRVIQLELNTLGIKSVQANIYQELASYLLFLHSGRKDREGYIKAVTKHQEDLWAYGISGDLPIVMVLVKDKNDIDLLRVMIKMHYYWKSKGVKSDLLVYNDEESSYEQPMQKNIMNIVQLSKEGDGINQYSGIFIHNNSTMSKEIRDFIIGISAFYIDSTKGSIITKMEELQNSENIVTIRHKELDLISGSSTKIVNQKQNNSCYEGKFNIKKSNDKHNYEGLFDISKLDFWNGYGGFDPDDKGYVIRLDKYKNTPAPWINVISNGNFGFHVSEVGSAYTWCGNSRENKITPWSNDWVTDPITEAMFIRDNKSGEYFSITPKPVRDDGEYIIKHSFGYSVFEHISCDIKGKIEMFCPMKENVKIQKVTLENLLDEEKEISLLYYAQLVLGVFNYESARHIVTSLGNNFIIGENTYSKYFGKFKSYISILGGENLTFTGDRKEFLGVNREISNPRALSYENLSNSVGSIYDPCLASSTKFILKPNEKKEIIVLLGQEEKVENIEKMIEKYKTIGKCDNELEKVKKYWSDFLGNIQVKTKDKSMDYLLNGWLLYQNYSCRYLSRTAFYQSGGAYGFRDQLQDSMSLGIINPDITKEQILRNASRQYIEGDVQHWWHPIVNSGIRTRFSDDLLWLPYVTAQYIEKTGDYTILNEIAPYLEDEPLEDGEDERYTVVNNSTKVGTIYEHCIKAIEKSLKFGEHNIPLMGSGDWNDGMSTVGNKGKGESVWLGWFLYSILDKFKDICRYINDTEKENKYIKIQEFIRENLEKNAWDGGWYRRAYFDDGTPLGSRENQECQIDSLSQSWSVISGAAKDSRIKEAMEAVDNNLVKKDKGMILLLAPPFEKSDLEPGYIKGYVSGVRENGGQYTHAAVWVIMALTKLGLGDKAWKYYNMINPINHTRTELECKTYKVEPYVMAADVYIKEPHAGRGGWSWYTGAAGWMYKVGIEDILGLKQIEGKYYKIEPCIPKDWDEYSIYIKNETEDYKIRVFRGNRNFITINGEGIEGGIIPRNKGELNIEVEFV